MSKPKQSNKTGISHLQDHTGFWLRYVSNHVSHAFSLKLLSSGVTVAEWVILREMFNHDAIAPSTLAQITGLTRGAISKLVDRLVDKKLISRKDSRDDRRFQAIALTAAGRTLLPSLAKLADENDEQFFSSLSAKEREALITSLKKLVLANGLNKIPTE